MIDNYSSSHSSRRAPFATRILRATVPLLGAVLVAACGASSGTESNESVDEVANPIQAGKVENGFPAVGEVSTDDGFCTGSLIAPRFVLTAKHCAGAHMKFSVGTSPSNFVDYTVDEQHMHPSKDILVAHLTSAPPGIAALSFNRGALPAVGATCTAVGFGAHDEDSGAVTFERKRSCTEKVESADDTTIKVKMVSGIADHGDSGGPLLCGGKIAAVVHNHTDGNWPSHVHENYATIDDNWLADVLNPPPPPPPPSECGTGRHCCEREPGGGCSLCFADGLTCP